MELQLVGLKASGLRCAEIDIDLGAERPTRFTFVQMPNGTGKTTIAECLRAVLSGEAHAWDADKVRSLRRLGDDDNGNGSGRFEARFLLDDRPLAVGMNFDFGEGTCGYYTTHPPRGRKPKHDLPQPLGRFADAEFVRLYVFDAELPQQLLDRKSHRAEQAIDAFYQLYVLQQVSDGLEQYFERAVDEAKASTTQGLNRAKNRLDILRERRGEIRRRQQNWTSRVGDAKAEQADKEAELEQHLSEIEQYSEQKQAAEAEFQDAQARLTTEIDTAFVRLQSPLDAYPHARQALDALAESLDSLRLPEATSRQFFHELTQQDTCVCGRPMDADAKAAVVRAAEDLLQDDSAGVINALKGDIRTLDREEVCQSPAEHAATLTRLLETRDRAATQLEQLRNEASARSDERAQELNEDLKQLREEIARLEDHLEEMSRESRPGDDENSDCLKWFDEEINRLEQRVADITHTVTLRERKNQLQQVLGHASTRAADAARQDLVTATNARLEALLPGENVNVAEIGPSVQLHNRDGLNMGAMLSVGYAFLTTLFERGNHSFPFVVDAPSMGLDGLAREALAQLLPEVTSQFVGLVLDNERDFVRTVRAMAPEDCRFYTIFSDTSRNRPLTEQVDNVEPGPGGTYVIEGFDFFDAVQWTSSRKDGAADA